MARPRQPSATILPNGPLRDAYLASGVRPSEVCRRLGWVRTNGSDVTRLNRALGLKPTRTTTRNGRVSETWVSTIRVDLCEQDLDSDKTGSLAKAIGELRGELSDLRALIEEWVPRAQQDETRREAA